VGPAVPQRRAQWQRVSRGNWWHAAWI